MARQMKLFLIRHGETVDNVAQVYAGSRDSALTNHGYQQATRLGLHFNALGLCFTHIYSSHLQRAAKTAGLIREAQTRPLLYEGAATVVPDIVQLPVLMERDFGFYEGKKWYEKPLESKVGSEQSLEHKKAVGFVDIESKDSMAQRVDAFLDGHLLPLLDTLTGSTDQAVAVVSHGIILSVLWKRLLLRLPPKSVSFSPELSVAPRVSLEHLGAWSNTGYLELHMKLSTQTPNTTQNPLESTVSVNTISQNDNATVVIRHLNAQQITQSDADTKEQDRSDASIQHTASATQAPSSKLAPEWTAVIQTVNGKAHLKGLKRTRGGVGSARHDASQKSIDGFFKRQKIG
ncbi:phosphoglycerate mutase-like protein [Melanomma pulvis-pyrius CBS 109.77]|uniref:Phosphoglycerate mutase-like protein n=1 Tax=Melanomma pulvis-pyrius CBS 109.77 TaxID=1314802 RepID=A0A6A6X8A6_9PLEO|nr:phosphoglycerate mutase-like protein [Melanomma pulvis-pyrius CBS 109.77]